MDVTSIVPNAVEEKYVLDLIGLKQQFDESESDADSDEEEFDIVFYINPKLLESLTGGPGQQTKSDHENKDKSS